MHVLVKKYLKQATVALFFVVPSYSAELSTAQEIVDDGLSLGRNMPAYFKIMTFDKTRWEAFADAFPGHPATQSIKMHLESIQLIPLVFSRNEIFASEFFKKAMRQKYCNSFKGDLPSAPLLSDTNSDEMYAAILNLLHADESAFSKFEEYIAESIVMYEKIIAAYNHRLEMLGGNSALLKHFLAKIFFASNAYADSTLINMRMTLLAEGLVAGDDYLFAEQKDPSHTLAKSILKYIQLEGHTDTLVIGCGHSLIADVAETPRYLADDFLKAYTGKTFVHDCQHCLCDHGGQIAVALSESDDISYNGAAHADVFANATTSEFWEALKTLNDEGVSPIRCIIDHAFMLSNSGEQIANSLPIGGIFRTYLDLTEHPLEPHGFVLQGAEQFGERVEKIYVKVS